MRALPSPAGLRWSSMTEIESNRLANKRLVDLLSEDKSCSRLEQIFELLATCLLWDN